MTYIPILTRSAVAPPGSVPAGTICVSPTGNALGDGSPANPYDLATGNAALTDGGALLLLDGIYSIASYPQLGKAGATLQTTVKAQTGARPILTTPSGVPPSITLWARTTLDGVWMGGVRGVTDTAIVGANDCIIQNCTFFNYYEGIVVGSQFRQQFLNNRFANCGTGSLYHDIYYTAQPAASADGTTISGNIHVGGEGYKIQLWHEPTYATIQRNFCAGGWGIVINGDGHTVDHNIVWPPGYWLYMGVQPTNTTVNTNIAGPNTPIVEALGAGSTSDGNIFMQQPWGTNPVFWTYADWQSNTGYSVAQVDDTVNNLTDAFSQLAADLWIDNGIEPLFTILAAVRDAVAGSVPPQDSPYQAVQEESARTSRRRGGTPLSHKHKGGRNRLGFTRSRRLTTR